MASETDYSALSLNEMVHSPLPAHMQNDPSGVDISLLKISLAMTPWQRLQANDDALNFAESLRAAMIKSHAKLG